MPRAAPTSSIMAAAVADYRPADVSDVEDQEGAQGDAGMTLELVRNPDILAGLGHAPHDGTLLVGFAAETEPDDDAPARARPCQARGEGRRPARRQPGGLDRGVRERRERAS